MRAFTLSARSGDHSPRYCQLGEAKLTVGIVVVAVEEKSARQVQLYPFRVRLAHQDAAIERDGGVIIFLRPPRRWMPAPWRPAAQSKISC